MACGSGVPEKVRAMNTLVLRPTSVCLALLLAACSATHTVSQGSSGAGNASPVAGTGGATVSNFPPLAAAEAGGSLAGGGAFGTSLAGSGGSGGSGGSAGSAGATTAGAGGGSAGTASVPPSQLVTSAQDAFWQTGTLTEAASDTPDLIVDDSTTYQTFDGFGGTFNEKSWSYLAQLSESERSQALNLLFGADGARFAFGRLPIGANEYALDRYTLDITATDTTPDLQMEKFSISRDLNNLIPFVKAALALRPDIHFLAVPWTPPVWMKTGVFRDEGAAARYDGGNMSEDSATLSAFALYLSKFVQEYAKQGISIEAIAVQREPSFAENFPSCLWTMPLYLKFVREYLAPTFAAQGASTKIYLGLMENGEETSLDTALVSNVRADPEALKSFSGFGFEWGMIKQMPRVTPLNLPILQTEHQPGNEPWVRPFQQDKAPNDFAYAIESWGLIRNWLEAGATAYIAKHMVLDSVGLGLDSREIWPQNSLLVVDTVSKTLTATPAYYVFDHFSHFIARGAKRVKVTSTSLSALAFKNPDGSMVTVIRNADSSAKSLAIALGGASYRFTIPGNGFATVFKGS
jgi:glucosylceramidase